MKVYVLHHVHAHKDGSEDVKLIGIYSSRESATGAIDRVRHAPGFSQMPEGFHIDEYPVDKDHWCEGFVI